MKKVFITLGVLILVVITALMVIPTFFKGDKLLKSNPPNTSMRN